MSISVSGSQITFNDASTQTTAATGFGFKNRIINGSMLVWQRGTSSSTAGAYGSADRWYQQFNTSGTFSQSTDVPSGFKYSLSVNGTNYPQIYQKIESNNCYDLVGQSVTISLWIKQSSGAGSSAMGIGLQYANSADNFSATTSINSFAITTTSSWAQYTFTFTNLPSGAANGLQIQLYANTSGAATYLVTGVQLEKGSTATSFDYRPYGTELALCLRYFYSYNALSSFQSDAGGYARQPLQVTGTTSAKWYPQYPVLMRVCPTITSANIASAATSIYNYSTASGLSITSISANEGSIVAGQISFNVASGFSIGNVATWRWEGNNSGTYIWFSSEL